MDQDQKLIPAFRGGDLVVHGEIAVAKRWIDGAGLCERAKLFCQVMAGFELLAIWKKHGFNQGQRNDLNFSHGGKSEAVSSENGPKLTVAGVCEQLGQSQSTVYRLMEMAKASIPRLRKVPELATFDPVAVPLQSLPPAQKEALHAAVHKLTDDKTQKEFGEQLGLWKVPQGEHGGNPHAAGKRALTAAEKALKIAEEANAISKAIQEGVFNLGVNFTALPDEDNLVTLHYVDGLARLLRSWTNMPPEKRDVAEVQTLFNRLFKP